MCTVIPSFQIFLWFALTAFNPHEMSEALLYDACQLRLLLKGCEG